MEIQPIKPSSLDAVQQVLSSKQISSQDKADYVRANRSEIKQLCEEEVNITGRDFQNIMKNRPLQRFRPIKNSFTKRGDKIILAMALGIEPEDVDDYTNDYCDNIVAENQKDINKMNADRLNKIKTYVYRHGTKEQVIKMLDNELTIAKDKLQALYQTLEYNTGGVADYFTRPIHRMDNTTMINIYNVIDSHLDEMQKTNQLSAEERDETSQWALVRIYRIQNNSKLIRDYKAYKELTR